MLNIEQLYKSFGDKQVLKGIDLTIPEGSVFGLVGINGAGKSTLLRLIAGVYRGDKGTIRFNDQDTYLEPAVRRKIAFVPDEQYFPVGSTIRSLKMLYETMYDFSEEDFRKYLEVFELTENMAASNLSKGMKRRVSLLFALSVQPDLLLLDEAYDGLEPVARLRFRQSLADLIEERHITVIISGHNLRELEDICDTFGILEDGGILRSGDLLESRSLLNKYQIAFDKEPERSLFDGLDILHYEQEGRVCKLVIRGAREEVTEKLHALHPLLLDVLPATFEELFIYELESRGHSYE